MKAKPARKLTDVNKTFSNSAFTIGSGRLGSACPALCKAD